MTDDELIQAIKSFKDEVKADALDVRLESLGGELEKSPVCTTLENIEAVDDNTKLKVTTSAKEYTFAFGGKLPTLIEGFTDEVVTTYNDKYTATLRFTDVVSVDKEEQKSVVLVWPIGRVINGKDADEKYNKYKPATYKSGRTQFKFSPAAVSLSATGLSTTITGASVGVTGAEFSMCLAENVFRVLGVMLRGFNMGVTGAEAKLAGCKSKLSAIWQLLFPIGTMVSALRAKNKVVEIEC